jgi:Metal binding domain of Ada
VSYTLLGGDGQPYESDVKGQWGGHRGTKIYGRLDCPSALRAITRGGYVRQRVFFADEATAIAAGYRPCATCCRDRYDAWKAAGRQRAGTSWEVYGDWEEDPAKRRTDVYFLLEPSV